MSSDHSRLSRVARRFLVPRIVVTLIHLCRNRSKVSHRAEVDFTSNLRLGPRSTIGSFTKIKALDGEFVTGRQCLIGTGCFLASHAGGLRIGDDFMCGPNVTIVCNSYEFARLDIPFREQMAPSKGVRIGNNVVVGAGAVIIDGAHIGDNTMVMANSLVTRRFPPNCVHASIMEAYSDADNPFHQECA